MDKIGIDGVINELENQEFSKRSIDLLIPFLDIKGSFKSKIDFLSRKLKDIEVAKEGLDDLFSIYSKINKFKLNCISVNLDINLARGLDYYTGLILEVVPDKGEFDFGSIAGGGRYDNLTDFFGFDKDLVLAISEQYLPTGSGSRVPKKPFSIALSLADKIDTLVGFFGLNQSQQVPKIRML